METPHFECKHFANFFQSSVYEPAEDTFVLMDSIEHDLDRIQQQAPLVCLEIGCGSGAVINSLAKALGPCNSLYLATDLNFKALECTRKCSELFLCKQAIQLVRCDLSAAFAGRLEHLVDLLLFNPPYVPTVEEEIDHTGDSIKATWAGGNTGRQIIDCFIVETLNQLLSATGLAYLVVIEPNNSAELRSRAVELGFECTNVLTRKCGIEKLSVLRLSRIHNTTCTK